MYTVSFWRHGTLKKEGKSSEGWHTVRARTTQIWPQMCQIYAEDGQLRGDDGKPSGTYIQFVLTADKPALCKILGRRTFSHDCFSPCCACSESAGNFYDMSHDPLTHYGTMTFEKRCSLALVPLHEALGQPEPEDWKIFRENKVIVVARPRPKQN